MTALGAPPTVAVILDAPAPLKRVEARTEDDLNSNFESQDLLNPGSDQDQSQNLEEKKKKHNHSSKSAPHQPEGEGLTVSE